jgi:hypothetical protein
LSPAIDLLLQVPARDQKTGQYLREANFLLSMIADGRNLDRANLRSLLDSLHIRCSLLIIVSVDASVQQLFERSVGVKDVSRLISRLRHRQFGILVTTSFVGPSAYKEIKDDGHPIIVLAASDIAQLFRKQGLDDPRKVKSWLEQEFPRT